MILLNRPWQTKVGRSLRLSRERESVFISMPPSVTHCVPRLSGDASPYLSWVLLRCLRVVA